MLKEFKEFALRGNVLDMAVGIIIGAAFTAIVKSAVSDIIMPPIGMMTGGVDFSDIFINLSGGEFASLAAAQEAGAATINVGVFINAVINFLIVAAVIFILIKQVNRLKRAKDDAPAEAPPPPRSEVVLEEIRDLLKKACSRGDPGRRRRGRPRDGPFSLSPVHPVLDQIVDHRRIGKGRGVAQRLMLVGGDLAQDAAHDLA